jgi:hypothetical protein
VNLVVREDETSLIDSFSLNVGNDDEDDEFSETSDVTWLTYRDENCNEVKEEFIRRLKLQTRVLSVEERRALLEGIVAEQRQRDEEEKQKRKLQQVEAAMNDVSLSDVIEEGDGAGGGGGDQEQHGNKMTGSTTHPAALFDANLNFVGVSDRGDDHAHHHHHYNSILSPPSFPSTTIEPSMRYSGIGGGAGRITGGLELVHEETRSDIRAERGPGSRSDPSRCSVTSKNSSSQQQHQQQHQQQQQYNINQEHINSIVNLKLLVANQQAMIDTLTSKLHNSELANSILQSENKILRRSDELLQQQLMKKSREVVEAQTLVQQQEQRLLLQSKRLSSFSSSTASTNYNNIITEGRQNAIFPIPSSSALPPTQTNTSSNSNMQEQFTIQALESKLKKMDEMNKMLMMEKLHMQREIHMLKKKDEVVTEDVEAEAAAAAEEVKEEIQELDTTTALNNTSLTLGGEKKKSQTKNSIPLSPTILSAVSNASPESSSEGEKQVALDTSNHFHIPYVHKKNTLPPKALSSEVIGMKRNLAFSIKPGRQPSDSGSDLPPRFPTHSDYASSEKSSDKSSIRGGGGYQSQIASSNKLFSEAKLLGGLMSRLAITNRLTNRGDTTVRVEDLSNKLIPVVGVPKFCVMIYNVLTPAECLGLIRRAKGEQFEELIYYRPGLTGESPNVSSCKRCRFSDSGLAWDLFERISDALKGTPVEQAFQRRPSLEEIEEGGGAANPASDRGSVASRGGSVTKGKRAGASVTRISQPFNVIRYDVGEFFAPHRDTTFRTGTEVSRLTLQVFLNEKFSGGVTSIRDGKKYFDIKPKAGSVLLVDQELRREECYVVSGKKYVIRADVMYDECKVDLVTAVTGETGTTKDTGTTKQTEADD